MGGNCDCKIVRGYPFLINDENLPCRYSLLPGSILEPKCDGCRYLDGAEDFAWYSQAADSCFYLLELEMRKTNCVIPSIRQFLILMKVLLQ
jgi:amidohydrolase